MIKLVLLHLFLFVNFLGINAMAGDQDCSSSVVVQKLKKQYEERNLDASKLPKVDSERLKKVMTTGIPLCVINDRLNNLVHSYSITVYRDSKSDLYLIYEGGFAGSDQYGYGPITESNL